MHSIAARLRTALDRRPWLAPVGVAVIATATLLVRLGTPGRIIFDETYYVEDAIGYLDIGVEPSFAVHPTLGKWLIAGSISLFGDDPFGWRFAGVVAGVATVVLTYLLARRLLRDTRSGWWLSLLAPVLLLADGLFIAQTRIAMLDAFLVLFATAALYVLVVDRQRRRDGTARQRGPSLRVLAGVLLGLALAVKWSGLLAIGAAGLLTIGWEVGDARRRGRLLELVPRGAAVVGSLVLVPALVYGASWLPWLAEYENSSTAGCDEEDVRPEVDCDFTAGERVAGLVRHHRDMLNFHLGLEATHNYRSDPLGWPVLARPVVYYWSNCTQEKFDAGPQTDEETGEVTPGCEVALGDAGEILAVGNPGLWWGWLLLTPLLVGGTALRDRRSAVPLVVWLSTWLPWLAVSRTAFLFYMAPAVPMLAVGVPIALQRLGDPVQVRRTYLGALFGAGLGLVVAGAILLSGLGTGARVIAFPAALGWTLGAASGAVADHRHGQPPRPPLASAPPPTIDGSAPAPTGPTTVGRWALGTAVVTVGLAIFFAPVWYGVAMDADAVRLRWWFDTWV